MTLDAIIGEIFHVRYEVVTKKYTNITDIFEELI